MKPLVRWTIGNSTPNGYESLLQSVINFRKLYDVDIVVCHNNHPEITDFAINGFKCIDQTKYNTKDIGVAWKLYPSRLGPTQHEIFIDNDLIIESHIDEIDQFLGSNSTLLLEGEGRNYGRFNNHVPPGFNINSGLFGVPPNFNLQKYINFFSDNWQNNCSHSSHTWDEQGLVAFALLSYEKHVIIPNTKITNCESNFKPAQGMHFVGLNRRKHHQPWNDYKYYKLPFYL